MGTLKHFVIEYFFFKSAIMTLETCFYSVGVFNSFYAPEVGQCFVNIKRSMLDVCTMLGTTGSRQFIIQIFSRKYSFCKHPCTIRGDRCSVAYTTQIAASGTEMASQVQWKKIADFMSALSYLMSSPKFRYLLL